MILTIIISITTFAFGHLNSIALILFDPHHNLFIQTFVPQHHLTNISFPGIWIECRTASSARENHLTCHSENDILHHTLGAY